MPNILVSAAFSGTAKTVDLNLCFKRCQSGVETTPPTFHMSQKLPAANKRACFPYLSLSQLPAVLKESEWALCDWLKVPDWQQSNSMILHFLQIPHSQVISFLTPATCDKLNQNICFPNLNLVAEISSVGWPDPFWGAIPAQNLISRTWAAVLNGRAGYRVFPAS